MGGGLVDGVLHRLSPGRRRGRAAVPGLRLRATGRAAAGLRTGSGDRPVRSAAARAARAGRRSGAAGGPGARSPDGSLHHHSALPDGSHAGRTGRTAGPLLRWVRGAGRQGQPPLLRAAGDASGRGAGRGVVRGGRAVR